MKTIFAAVLCLISISASATYVVQGNGYAAKNRDCENADIAMCYNDTSVATTQASQQNAAQQCDDKGAIPMAAARCQTNCDTKQTPAGSPLVSCEARCTLECVVW